MLSNGAASVRSICCLVVLCAAVFFLALSGHAQSIDDTYKQALKEGGTLNVYGTLTPDTAVKVLPVFEKRFPGIKTVNTGASSDKIVARAISEARGGRTIGDVFHMNLENVMQVHEQGLCLKSCRRKPTPTRAISKVLTGWRRASILWWWPGTHSWSAKRTSQKVSKSSPSRNGKASSWPSRETPRY